MLKSSSEQTLIIELHGDRDQMEELLKLLARRVYKAIRDDRVNSEGAEQVVLTDSFCSGHFKAVLRSGDTLIEEPGDIDRKFEIKARSRHSGNVYTEAHGVFFNALDVALPAILLTYVDELRKAGAGVPQLEAAYNLFQRVMAFQIKHTPKLPDVNPEEEPYIFKDEPTGFLAGTDEEVDEFLKGTGK